ncbi:MAG TPA: proton-conducting transporter membrane subunit, partial [Phycisphaerales bacterium]|nr:proton-conducting transporter membrane subunit [Phycisphaerales bacterium]
YVWFEVMLVASFVLMAHNRTRAQMDAAFKYVAINLIASSIFLTALGLLYGAAGTLNMADLANVWPTMSTPGIDIVLATLFLIAFSIKAGLFPLFFWLPASYHTAPISVGAALAGLLTKVAFYACLRVFVLVFGLGARDGPAVVPGLPALLGILAGATMIVSVLAAIAQVDVRRLLAFHVVGQVAYLTMGLAVASLLGVAAAIFYTMHTMLVQAGLFLGAGAIARANRGYDLRAAGGLMRDQPVFAALFALLALSISGVPPLSGFWAKFLVIDAAFRADSAWYAWLAVVALVAGALTLYSMSTLWTQAFWRTRDQGRAASRPVPPAMLVAVAMLAACTLGIGLAVEPVARLARDSAARMTSAAMPGTPR